MSKATLVRTFLICSLAVVAASAAWAGQAPAVDSAPIPAVSQPVQTATTPSLDNLRWLIFQPPSTNQASCNWDCTALYDQCEAGCEGCAPRVFSCNPGTCYFRCVCWYPYACP